MMKMKKNDCRGGYPRPNIERLVVALVQVAEMKRHAEAAAAAAQRAALKELLGAALPLADDDVLEALTDETEKGLRSGAN